MKKLIYILKLIVYFGTLVGPICDSIKGIAAGLEKSAAELEKEAADIAKSDVISAYKDANATLGAVHIAGEKDAK